MWNEKVRLLKEQLSAALALALFLTLIAITHLSLYSNDPYYQREELNALQYTNQKVKEELILKTPEELWSTPLPANTYRSLTARKQVVESSAIN